MLSREVLRHGLRCTVFALTLDGGCEVTHYLMELPEDVRLKVYAIIRRLGDEGFVPNTQKFRRLDDNVYELKLMHPAIRLFCFRSGPDWVGTHGEKKPGKRDVRAHIAKVKALANRYRQEWI